MNQHVELIPVHVHMEKTEWFVQWLVCKCVCDRLSLQASRWSFERVCDCVWKALYKMQVRFTIYITVVFTGRQRFDWWVLFRSSVAHTDPGSVLSQVKQEELEELNKELRQCNLQQFIQQTGVLPAHTHSRTELQEQLEQLELAHLLQDGYSNRGVWTDIVIY